MKHSDRWWALHCTRAWPPRRRFSRGGCSQPGDLLSTDILAQGPVCVSRTPVKLRCAGVCPRGCDHSSLLKSEPRLLLQLGVSRRRPLCVIWTLGTGYFSFKYCFCACFFFNFRNEGGYMVKTNKGRGSETLSVKKAERPVRRGWCVSGKPES